MAVKNVIIDCDTGVDDALALLLALRSPQLNVLGITTVAGNVPLNKVLRNTLVIVEHSGKQVPVYEGSYRCLVGTGGTAEDAHGSDGLGDIGFPEPQTAKQSEHAVDYLVRTINESNEPVDLITLAPLTNIAHALAKDPHLADRIHSLTMMAGGIENGNSTVAAEFNVWVDPEAADLVFRSRIPNKTMVALDPIRQGGGIYPEDIAALEADGKPWSLTAARLLTAQQNRWKQFTGETRPVTPPDLAAVGIAIDPTLGKSEMLRVDVETGGVHTRGMTVVDRRPFRGIFREAPKPNVNVVLTIDNPRYRKLVTGTLLGKEVSHG